MGCLSDLALVQLNREFLLNVDEGVKRDALCVFLPTNILGMIGWEKSEARTYRRKQGWWTDIKCAGLVQSVTG